MKKTKSKIKPRANRGSVFLMTLIALLFISILLLLGVIGLSGRWSCINGQWIKQGFPLSGMPQGGCEIKTQKQANVESESNGYDGVSPEMEQMARDAEKPEVSGVEVTNIKEGDSVRSPLVVKGRARGTWYFEGEFPIKLMDGKGNFFATGNVMAKGDWMTQDWVPFEGTIKFQKPATSDGSLWLIKNDPAGMVQNSYSTSISIKFSK